MLRIYYEQAIGTPVSWGWDQVARIGVPPSANRIFRGRLWAEGVVRCPETSIAFIMTVRRPLPLLLAACNQPATTLELIERLRASCESGCELP